MSIPVKEGALSLDKNVYDMFISNFKTIEESIVQCFRWWAIYYLGYSTPPVVLGDHFHIQIYDDKISIEWKESSYCEDSYDYVSNVFPAILLVLNDEERIEFLNKTKEADKLAQKLKAKNDAAYRAREKQKQIKKNEENEKKEFLRLKAKFEGKTK